MNLKFNPLTWETCDSKLYSYPKFYFFEDKKKDSLSFTKKEITQKFITNYFDFENQENEKNQEIQEEKIQTGFNYQTYKKTTPTFDYDIDSNHDDDSDDEEEYKLNNSFTIFCFGRDFENKSILVRIENFKPTIYLLLDETKTNSINQIIEAISNLTQVYIGKKKFLSTIHSFDLFNGNDIWGYQTNQKKYLKIVFDTERAFKKVLYFFKNRNNDGTCKFNNRSPLPRLLRNIKTFNGNISPLHQFVFINNLEFTSPLVCNNYQPVSNDFNKIANVDFEYICDYNDVQLCSTSVNINYKEMAFDIEVYSYDNKFPNPNINENSVFQIGATIKNYNDSETKKFLLTFGANLSDYKNEEFEILSFASEKDLILGFKDFINFHNPDFIYSYNGDRFDWLYIFVRASKLNILSTFSVFSRFKNVEVRLFAEKFSSSAYGDTTYDRPFIPGRLSLDLLIFVMRSNEKYSNYKLDTIAESKLGQHKDPVTPLMIFDAFRSKDPEKNFVVGKYAVQDTDLVQKLVNKLNMIPQIVEMSSITITPILHLFTKGQSIKAFAVIAKEASKRRLLIPDDTPREEGKFKGATVISPEVGIFHDPVAILDFASLYPSIQMAYNICYSSIVIDDKQLNGSEITHEINWVEDDGSKRSYQFVQNTESLIPFIQKNLVESRKRVKREMKNFEKNSLNYRVLHSRELAIKVTMNSIYGFTSAYLLHMKELAACVTTIGREMINQTKQFMEHDFPKIVKTKHNIDLKTRVIAGDTDSVFTLFPGISIDKTIELSKEAEVYLTDTVFNRAPIRMEYEKIFCPFISLTKKRYSAKVFTDDSKKFTFDAKGVATKRRNYCKFVASNLQKLFEISLGSGNDFKEKIINLVETELNRLVINQVNISELQISNALKSNYKNQHIPHVYLAEKMKIRDPSSAPLLGERFFFVFVEAFSPGGHPLPIWQRAEVPDYIEKNNLKIDLLYYLENQFKKPIEEFLRLIFENEEIEKIFNRAKNKIVLKQKKQKTITSFFK